MLTPRERPVPKPPEPLSVRTVPANDFQWPLPVRPPTLPDAPTRVDARERMALKMKPRSPNRGPLTVSDL